MADYLFRWCRQGVYAPWFMRLIRAHLSAAAALLVPAALGSSLGVSAAERGSLNLDGIGQYSASADQVASVTQFSDVQPTDWAYQALSNLIERYGCVAGYPNATYRGSRAMTRYEAAALLRLGSDLELGTAQY